MSPLLHSRFKRPSPRSLMNLRFQSAFLCARSRCRYSEGATRVTRLKSRLK